MMSDKWGIGVITMIVMFVVRCVLLDRDILARPAGMHKAFQQLNIQAYGHITNQQ